MDSISFDSAVNAVHQTRQCRHKSPLCVIERFMLFIEELAGCISHVHCCSIRVAGYVYFV